MKDGADCDAASKEILAPCPKAEAHQGPEVGVVTDTLPNRGDGWHSWNAAGNGNFFCDGNATIRGREPSAATGILQLQESWV